MFILLSLRRSRSPSSTPPHVHKKFELEYGLLFIFKTIFTSKKDLFLKKHWKMVECCSVCGINRWVGGRVYSAAANSHQLAVLPISRSAWDIGKQSNGLWAIHPASLGLDITASIPIQQWPAVYMGMVQRFLYLLFLCYVCSGNWMKRTETV